MSYIDGVVTPVPVANKEKFKAYSEQMAPLFKEHGALRCVDAWAEEVPDGDVNSLNSAVMKKDDEVVVFSWIEWPSKAVRDTAWAALQEDPRMRDPEMPWDGSRMIFGGFDKIVDV